MISVFMKTHKSSQNLHGAIEIDGDKGLESPCMLCISAQETSPKSVFGIIREGMRSARLRTRVDDAARYDLDNFPAKFLGVSHSNEKPSDDYIRELAERLFVPLYCPDNTRLSTDVAKKKARNITLMTYCDGTRTYIEVEKYTIKKMQEVGYQQEEIKEILGQQCLLAMDTDTDIRESLSTCIEFRDINDCELMGKKYLEDALNQTSIKHSFGKYTDNTGVYYYSGSGDHSIKSYYKENNLAGVAVARIVTESISNSIINNSGQEPFKPISIASIYLGVKDVLDKANKGLTCEEILRQIDKDINYSTAKTLTLEECRRLAEVDSLCDMVLKRDNDILMLRRDTSLQLGALKDITNAIEETVPPQERNEILSRVSYFNTGTASTLEEQPVDTAPMKK